MHHVQVLDACFCLFKENFKVDGVEIKTPPKTNTIKSCAIRTYSYENAHHLDAMTLTKYALVLVLVVYPKKNSNPYTFCTQNSNNAYLYAMESYFI